MDTAVDQQLLLLEFEWWSYFALVLSAYGVAGLYKPPSTDEVKSYQCYL